jgi:hypothetical protein
MKKVAALALPAIVLSQAGCVMAGGYSSGGGWFGWPIGLIVVLVVVLYFFVGRRGRL